MILVCCVMKSSVKALVKDVERNVGKTIDLHSDFEKLMAIFKKHHFHLSALSPQAKDRLALLAGFQNWKDFQETLLGEDDGQVNYESGNE